MHRVAAMDEESKTEEATAKLQAAIEQVGVCVCLPPGVRGGGAVQPVDGELLHPLGARCL